MQQLVKKGILWQWILAVCCVLTVSTSCDDKDPYDPWANFDHEAQKKWEDELILKYLEMHNITNYTKTNSGLYYVVQREGTGARPVPGQTVEVKYVGKVIQTGQKFDSTYDNASTYSFPLGARHVIPGWEEGIQLMQKDEKALFLVPSRLGYGLYGKGGVIGPNTPIMFEIELVSF